MQNEFELLTQPDPSRSMALKLHALHEDDRAWMLSQLDSETRSQLVPLLEELSSLGIQVDSDDIARMAAAAPPFDESLSSAGEDVKLINRAPRSRIDTVFDGEPPILFQQLAALQHWSWVDGDQAHHSGSTRFKSAMPWQKATSPAAVKQALIKVVAMQLRQQEALFGNAKNFDSGNSRKFDYSVKTSTTIGDRLKGLWSWAR